MSKLNLNTLLLVAFLLFYSIKLNAQKADLEDRNHVIVLINTASGMKQAQRLNVLKNMIRQDLKAICFKTGKVIPNRKLLDENKGDILSIATYGLNDGDNSLDDLVKISRLQPYGETIMRINNYDDKIFDKLWSVIDKDSDNYFSNKYRLRSIAKEFALKKIGNKNSNQIQTNKTFILFINDAYEAGSTTQDGELDAVKQLIGKRRYEKYKKEAKSFIAKFDRQYKIIEKTGNEIKRDLSGGNEMQLEVFELKSEAPLLEDLIDIPIGDFTINKKKDGFFSELIVKKDSSNNTNYEVTKMEISLLDGKDTIDKVTKDLFNEIVYNPDFDNSIKSKNNLELSLKAWVSEKGNLIGGPHIFSPNDSEYQNNFTESKDVRIEGVAYWFGSKKIPFWDFQYLEGWSLASVKRIWHGLLILISLVLFSLIVCFNYYKNIEMNKIPDGITF